MKTPDALSARSRELLVKAGDTIYKQDTVSDGAYVILEGRVEISHDSEGKTHRIATLDAGALLGEVGAIEKTPRSVTARALTDAKLLFIDAKSFHKIFYDSNPLIRYIIETLANRLRASYSGAGEHRGHDDAFYAEQFSKRESFMIGADSPIMEKLIPTPIEIMSIPFTVSNSPNVADEVTMTQSELLLPLPDHPELSIPHFEILHRDGKLMVRDLGSNFGTIVNSHAISRYGNEGVATLNPGINRIVAGSSDSFIRFLVQVPWVEKRGG